MGKTLVFDIETIPDYARSNAWMTGKECPPDQDADAWHGDQVLRMALHPEACQLVGLNVIKNDGPAMSGWVGEVNAKTGQAFTELDLLGMFWGWAAESTTLAGFNCLRFDLNVIRVRSAMLGLRPACDLFDAKPWENRIVDIMRKRFSDADRTQYMSLKALRRMYELQVPAEFDEVLGSTGADIHDLYFSFVGGDMEALRLLKLYGRLDVVTTKLLAQKWEGLFFPRIF